MTDGTAQQEKRLYPQQWEGIISASLDENNAELFLSTFEAMIDPQFLPYKEHIQAILYFVIHPPDDTEAALDILYHLLSIHSPAELCRGLPSHASSSTSKRDEDPAWTRWQAKGDLARKVKRAFRPCAVHGIWPLLWEPEPKGDSRVGSRSRTRTSSRAQTDDYAEGEDDDEDEEGSRRRRKISERGWVLLEWFVALWQQDAEEDPNLRSPTLLAQLPQPYSTDLPLNDATLPLEAIAQAYDDTEGVSPSQRLRRRSVSATLLELLVLNASQVKSPLDPGSLRASLIRLIRNLSPESTLLLFCAGVFGSAVQLNLLAIAIEDLAGVRAARAANRRTTGDTDFVSDRGQWPAPTIEYALTGLLPLALDEQDGQSDSVKSKIRILVELLLRALQDSRSWQEAPESQKKRLKDALRNFT